MFYCLSCLPAAPIDSGEEKNTKRQFSSAINCVYYLHMKKKVSFSSSISSDVFLDCIVNALKIKVHHSNGLESEQENQSL